MMICVSRILLVSFFFF